MKKYSKLFNNKKMILLKSFLLSLSILTFTVLIYGCGKMNGWDNKPVLLPVSDDPTVSFRIWFKFGSQNDPVGKEGLAYLTTMLITEGGTQNNSYEQILEKLYPLAASYNTKIDKVMTVFYGRTHKDNLNEFYNLFKDAILKPAFNEDDFNRVKSEALNYIEKTLRYSSDEELGKAILYDFIFDGTRYGHLTEGTIEGIKSITLDDIKKFYKTHFTSENFVIGLGGSYDDAFLKKIETDLATLPKSPEKQEKIEKPATKPINGLEFRIIEKEADATAISFGFPINVLRGQDDFYPLWIFNSWFGEHRNQSSHLYQVIREKRGMNYGDYSYIETFLDGGSRNMPEPNNPRDQQIFEVWIRPVQNQHRHFALRAAIRELQKVVENGLTQEQFDITKKFLMNYSLFYAQTTMDKLGYQIDSKFYCINDGGDYINHLRTKLSRVTLEDVNRAIKKHLQFKNIKIAIITRDAEKFKDELVNNTPSPITYASPVDEKVLEEDKIIESYPLKVLPENVKIIKVDDVFHK